MLPPRVQCSPSLTLEEGRAEGFPLPIHTRCPHLSLFPATTPFLPRSEPRLLPPSLVYPPHTTDLRPRRYNLAAALPSTLTVLPASVAFSLACCPPSLAFSLAQTRLPPGQPVVPSPRIPPGQRARPSGPGLPPGPFKARCPQPRAPPWSPAPAGPLLLSPGAGGAAAAGRARAAARGAWTGSRGASAPCAHRARARTPPPPRPRSQPRVRTAGPAAPPSPRRGWRSVGGRPDGLSHAPGPRPGPSPAPPTGRDARGGERRSEATHPCRATALEERAWGLLLGPQSSQALGLGDLAGRESLARARLSSGAPSCPGQSLNAARTRWRLAPLNPSGPSADCGTVALAVQRALDFVLGRGG